MFNINQGSKPLNYARYAWHEQLYKYNSILFDTVCSFPQLGHFKHLLLSSWWLQCVDWSPSADLSGSCPWHVTPASPPCLGRHLSACPCWPVRRWQVCSSSFHQRFSALLSWIPLPVRPEVPLGPHISVLWNPPFLVARWFHSLQMGRRWREESLTRFLSPKIHRLQQYATPLCRPADISHEFTNSDDVEVYH